MDWTKKTTELPNSSSLNSITSADSGYSSHEQKSEKVCRGAGKKEQRVFKTLLQNLSLLEFSDFDDKKERQFIIFKNYLDNHVSKRSKEIKEELHFATVDLAIREVFCSTVLPHNQGCAFLSILKSCSHKEIIEKVLEIYQIENQKSALCLLKKYIDKDGYNALHCLADLLVKKVELEVIIQPKDWNAFDWISSLCPELRQFEDFIGRTPVEIITEQTNLSLEERESYLV